MSSDVPFILSHLSLSFFCISISCNLSCFLYLSLFNYTFSTGRNFDEIIRVLDSILLTAKHKVATPANWKQGEDVIISGTVSNEDADKIFPGYKTVKPYLRTVAQPE